MPAIVVIEAPGLDDFLAHRIRVDIGRLGILVERGQPVHPDLDQPFGVGGQADHQRLADLEQLRRQLDPGDDRDVDDLDPAIGQVDRGRRLRRARHPQQDQVGGVEIVGHLAVVMGQGVVHRIDALEIFGVQFVLAPGQALGLLA